MTARRRHRRAAFSLLEVIVVLAVVLLVGAVIVPTLDGFMRDTNVKGAADLCVARLADTRGKAIEDGRPYRLAASPDGTRLRFSPDDPDQTDSTNTAQAEEFPLPKAVILAAATAAPASDGWTTLATYLPDGTCREPNAKFTLTEPGVVPYEVNVRGLTGAVTVNMVKGGR